ncbi:MAG: hypothetical protein ACI3XI_02440 [Eubacteriales bacterium]
MSIKQYLYEKTENNKASAKAKRIIVAVLVASTIFTGVFLTACEQQLNMSNEELASGMVEILQGQNEDLELSNIIIGSVDNMYMMVVSNFDMSEYVGYEISKSQFNKLLKLANEKNSDYIQVSPTGNAFVITEGGIYDENLKEINEIIYSTISKGKTIDLSNYIQVDTIEDTTQSATKPSIDLDNATDREYIEFGLSTNIELEDKEHRFDGFKADYIYVYPQKELIKVGGNFTLNLGVHDCFEFVDVYSKNDGEIYDSKKVVTFTAEDNFDMEGFLALLESKVDNDKIRKVENGYLLNTSIFDDKNMSDINAYLRKIAIGSGKFYNMFSYVAPLEEGEFAQEESEQVK